MSRPHVDPPAPTPDDPASTGVPSGSRDAGEVLGLLSILKLASLIVVGLLLSVAGVIAGHAVATMGEQMKAMPSAAAELLAHRPAWGALAGVPAVLCGAIGLMRRRAAWRWAAAGTIAVAAALVGIGVLVFGTLASLQEQLPG